MKKILFLNLALFSFVGLISYAEPSSACDLICKNYQNFRNYFKEDHTSLDLLAAQCNCEN